MNGNVTSALVDTGSLYSIITQEKARELGYTKSKLRLSALQGVTGSPFTGGQSLRKSDRIHVNLARE